MIFSSDADNKRVDVFYNILYITTTRVNYDDLCIIIYI